jgi:hypothetical protein
MKRACRIIPACTFCVNFSKSKISTFSKSKISTIFHQETVSAYIAESPRFCNS